MPHASDGIVFYDLHKDQLVKSGVPEIFWTTLMHKVQNQVFDAGESFRLLQIDYDGERTSHEPLWTLQAITNIKKTNEQHVYLIDHAWTFRIPQARQQLLEFDILRDRMCNILGLNKDLPTEEIVGDILENVWKLCRTYAIGNAVNAEGRLPIWYVMDEIGSAVVHSDSPNCRIVPFFHVNSHITYSLLFPIRDIDEGDFISVDFAEGLSDKYKRKAALLPWVPHSFRDLSFIPEAPGPDYYLDGHIEETLPIITEKIETTRNTFTVFTDYDLIRRYLTHPKFRIVPSDEEADILWITHHFKDYAHLSTTPHRFVNQFPFEYVITIKDLLALTCRKCLKLDDDSMESLKWFPTTYNLRTEIGNFLSYYQYRQEQGLDNYWIIKPYNLARGLDTHVTNNLDFIMRLPETGPKIVQKYITNPVLFYRPECEGSVKFDVRAVILLSSVEPLTIAVYKNFFLRFANKPFTLTDFDEYEKHFTVMNYDDAVVLKHMLYSDFKTEWKEQYPHYHWEAIEKSIMNLLLDVLKCAIKDKPPCGIAHSPQSRALYAADLILEWDQNKQIQPKLLEINWMPDCERACQYYEDFYNDVFGFLFLNQCSQNLIILS